jgi:hypothetical protein
MGGLKAEGEDELKEQEAQVREDSKLNELREP